MAGICTKLDTRCLQGRIAPVRRSHGKGHHSRQHTIAATNTIRLTILYYIQSHHRKTKHPKTLSHLHHGTQHDGIDAGLIRNYLETEAQTQDNTASTTPQWKGGRQATNSDTIAYLRNRFRLRHGKRSQSCRPHACFYVAPCAQLRCAPLLAETLLQPRIC